MESIGIERRKNNRRTGEFDNAFKSLVARSALKEMRKGARRQKSDKFSVYLNWLKRINFERTTLGQSPVLAIPADRWKN